MTMFMDFKLVQHNFETFISCPAGGASALALGPGVLVRFGTGAQVPGPHVGKASSLFTSCE